MWAWAVFLWPTGNSMREGFMVITIISQAPCPVQGTGEKLEKYFIQLTLNNMCPLAGNFFFDSRVL